MASLYEVRIRATLDSAGLRKGDQQMQGYFDSWVTRAKSASADVERTVGVAHARMTQSAQAAARAQEQVKSQSLRNELRAIEQANAAEIKAEQRTHAEAMRILKEKDRAIAAQIQSEERERKSMLSRELKAIEAANKAELQEEKRTASLIEKIHADTAKQAAQQAQLRLRVDKNLSDERAKIIKREQDDFLRAEAMKLAAEQRTAQQRRQLATGLQQTGQTVRGIGMGASIAVTAPIVAASAAIVAEGSEYEKAMNIFQATSRATAKEMQAASKVAIELGADLSLPATSAADAGDAMTALARKGFTATQSMEAARGVLQLSTATMVSTAEAAATVANAIHMYGLEAKEATHIADLFASASVIGGTELGELQYSFEQVGPVAHAANVSIETTVALLTEMALSGIKGEKAGTALRNMLINLTAPTKQAQGLLREMNVEVFDGSGTMRGFRDIVEQMAPALRKMTDEQRLQTLEAVFGKRAMVAAITVMDQGVEGLDRLTAAQGKQGAAAELAAARMKGLAGAWEGLKSQLETIALTIYALFSPVLTTMLQFVASVAQAVEKFGEAHPAITAVVAVLALLAATVGPLLIMLGALITLAGSAITAYTTLTATFAAVTAAFGGATVAGAALTSVLSAMAVSILPIAIGLGLLVAAYLTYESASDAANAVTQKMIESQAEAYTSSKSLAVAAAEVGAAQAGSTEYHEKLNTVLGRLDPATAAYVESLKREEDQVKVLNAEIQKNIDLNKGVLEAQLRVLGGGIVEQLSQIDAANQAIKTAGEQIQHEEDMIAKDPAWAKTLSGAIQSLSQDIVDHKNRRKELTDALTENEAKFFMNARALGWNREQIIQNFQAMGMQQSQIDSIIQQYDRLNPKVKENADATNTTTNATENQTAALAKLKTQLKQLADGTDADQARIEENILGIVTKAKSSAEATRMAREAAKDPAIAKLIAERRLHIATEAAARKELEPSKKEIVGGGGHDRRTPMENLQEQAKKLRFEIDALRNSTSRGFELRYQVEGLQQTKSDLEHLFKLRHELSLPLRAPLPPTYGGIRDEIRLHEQQKAIVDEVTKAKEAQSDADFKLASLMLTQSIPVVDSETRAQIKYMEALRDRRNAEKELTAELQAALRVRRDALQAEQNTMRDTYQQYVQLQLDSVKAAENARLAGIRSQLQFQIALGREPEIQKSLEVQLKAQASDIKSPVVSINERVGTIVDQIKQILNAVTGKNGQAVVGPQAPARTLSDLTSFIRASGFEVISTTGGSHNVGSRHYTGQAADIRTKNRTPAQVDALIDALRTEGYFVLDERTRPPGQKVWGGPNVHAQLVPFRSKRLNDLTAMAMPQSGRRTTPPVLQPGPGSPGVERDEVLATAAHSAGVNVADEQQYTRLTEAVNRHRDAVTAMTNAQQNLTNERAADLAVRQMLLQQTGKSLEQLSVEAALAEREQQRLTTDLAAATNAGIVEHDIAEARARDVNYVSRVATDASRSRAEAEKKTLDGIIEQEDYLARLRSGDARTLQQLYEETASQRLSGEIALTKQIVALEEEIAHAGETSALRRRVAALSAIREIQAADENAADSIVASQIRIADATRFHPIQAQAQLLKYFEQQKTVTQTVVDSMQASYEKLTTSVDHGLSKLLHGLGMVKDIVITLVNQLISGVFQRFAQALFGGGALSPQYQQQQQQGGFLSILGNLGSSLMRPFLTGGFAGGSGGNVYIGGGGTSGGTTTGIGSLGMTLPSFILGGGTGRTGATSIQGAVQRSIGRFFNFGSATDVPPSATDMAQSPWRQWATRNFPMTAGMGTATGGFSLSALAGSLGAMAPLLGLGLGAQLGQGSTLGTILGGAGGLIAGLGGYLGITAAMGGGIPAILGSGGALGFLGIGGTTGLGGLFGGLFGGSGALASFAAVAGPLALIAAPLIVGAILLARNAKRRKNEKDRAVLNSDTYTAVIQVLNDARAGKYDSPAAAIAAFDKIKSDYFARIASYDSKTKKIATDVWNDTQNGFEYYRPLIQKAAEDAQAASLFTSKFVPTYAFGMDAGLVPFTGGPATLIKVRPKERVDDVGAGMSWIVPGVDRGVDDTYTVATPGSRVLTPTQQQNVPGFSNGSPDEAASPGIFIIAIGDDQVKEMAKRFPHAIVVDKFKENISTTGGGDVLALLNYLNQRNGF